MGATGESVTRLTNFGHNPAWAPDGTSIVVATEGISAPYGRTTISQLWIIDVESGEATKIFDGDAVQPDWSPSGERIAFWGLPIGTGQRDLWTIAAMGGEEPVRVTDDVHMDWSPVWSPDGRYLYFSSDRGGTMNLWRILINESSGRVEGAPEPVTAPTANAGSLALARDGTHLVFQSINRRSNICKVGFDPVQETFVGNPLSVTQGSRVYSQCDPSPDGKWVAVSGGLTPEDLFLAADDGSEVRRLTHDPHKDRGPTWTPDGRHIVFYTNRADRYEIWWIRPDGSGLERLTESTQSFIWKPFVHSDGKLLFFMGDSGVIMTNLTPHTAERTYQELPKFPEPGVIFDLNSVSPDGRFLAGHRLTVDKTHVPGIVRYSLERKEYVLLHPRGYEPVWLRDSRRLLFADEDGMALLDSESRRVKRLTLQGVQPENVGSYAISRDGETFYFTEISRESDIWMATLD